MSFFPPKKIPLNTNYSPEFLFIPKDAEIVRTRDPTQLAECDIVVDVGGEFDPKRHRYDHHQRYGFIFTFLKLKMIDL